MRRWIAFTVVVGLVTAALALKLAVWLVFWKSGSPPAVEPTREALASALFARYGNVVRDEPSVRVPGRATTGFRTREWWLEDADEVLAFARRYPRG